MACSTLGGGINRTLSCLLLTARRSVFCSYTVQTFHLCVAFFCSHKYPRVQIFLIFHNAPLSVYVSATRFNFRWKGRCVYFLESEFLCVVITVLEYLCNGTHRNISASAVPGVLLRLDEGALELHRRDGALSGMFSVASLIASLVT